MNHTKNIGIIAALAIAVLAWSSLYTVSSGNAPSCSGS